MNCCKKHRVISEKIGKALADVCANEKDLRAEEVETILGYFIGRSMMLRMAGDRDFEVLRDAISKGMISGATTMITEVEMMSTAGQRPN